MNKIEWYAVTLAAESIEDTADDDLDEDEEFPDTPEGAEDHLAALGLAHDIARWIRRNGTQLLQLVGAEGNT